MRLDSERHSDHGAYVAMLRRMFKALARRMASADPDDLRLMLELSRDLDQAIDKAVQGLREAGFSWAQIAAPLGVTRQAAHLRWGKTLHAVTEEDVASH